MHQVSYCMATRTKAMPAWMRADVRWSDRRQPK